MIIQYSRSGVKWPTGIESNTGTGGAGAEDIGNGSGDRGLVIGGGTAAEQKVLDYVVKRLELTRLEGIVKGHDTEAFVVVSPVLGVSGGVGMQRVFH